MKKIQKHIFKQPLIILLGLVVFLCLAYLGLASYYHLWPFPQLATIQSLPVINYKKPTAQQTGAGQQTKEAFTTKQTEASQQQAAATGQAQAETSTVVSVQIPTHTLTPSSTTVSSIIDAIDGAGRCNLTLTKSGAGTITASSTTQTMGSYSSCNNFDLNLSGAPKGEWQVTLIYAGSANQSGKIVKELILE